MEQADQSNGGQAQASPPGKVIDRSGWTMMPRGCFMPVPFTNAVPSFLPKSFAKCIGQFRASSIDGRIFQKAERRYRRRFSVHGRSISSLTESRVRFRFRFDFAFPKRIRDAGTNRQDARDGWRFAPTRAAARTGENWSR